VTGPLPRRYQVLLWVVGVVACVGAGAWLAFSTPLPVLWQYGALLGALLAPLLVELYARTLSADNPPAPTRG
jgi:hypothetical protein